MIYTVRSATLADLPSILVIYNDVIATSTAVYAEDPVSLADREAWFRARLAQGYPVLVALKDDRLAGFASFGDFRAWPCYRYTVEHSVHVHRDDRGCGIGRALIENLIPIAETLNKHTIIAGVDAENTGSIHFHEKLGFEQVAHFRQVGFKFGRWLDLVFLQRALQA